MSLDTKTNNALLIKDWHLYFENGQTRRIKNLTYTLSEVDHDSITRKMLLRMGAEGYRALVVFSEIVGMAARCPQRGLLADNKGPITVRRIAGATGMTESDVTAGLELLASADVSWITYVPCPRCLICSGSLRVGRKDRPTAPEFVSVDNPSPDAPDLHIEWEYAIIDKGNGPETERRLPKAIQRLLDAETGENVACHSKKPDFPKDRPKETVCSNTPKPAPFNVACHTEGVDIQRQRIQPTEADRRAVERFVEDIAKKGLLGNTSTVKTKTGR